MQQNKDVQLALTQDESRWLEKYRRLMADGRYRVESQMDCELRLDALRREQTRKRQQGSIIAARQAGKKFGRPKVAYLKSWKRIYSQWQQKVISLVDTARTLGVSRATFYRMAQRYGAAKSNEVQQD